MRMFVCSIFDAAVNNYSPPFCVRAMGLAFRDFRLEMTNPGSRMAKSASDYSLFVLGEYDDEKASFMLLDAPRRVMTGPEALSSKEMLNEG